MSELFAEYKNIIVFLHVISGVVWVGGMIAMRFAAHPSFMQIQSPAHRLERISDALKKLFSIVTPFVLILLVTAILMIKGYELNKSEFAMLSHAKEGIWVVMMLNLALMMRRRKHAERFIEQGAYPKAAIQLQPIGKFMVPLNIILGIVAIYLGVTLSGSF